MRHVDHGKTTLTAAITKFFANVKPTTRPTALWKSGMTITTAQVEYMAAARLYAHVVLPRAH